MNVEFTSHKAEVLSDFEKACETALEAIGQQAEGNAVTEVTKMVYDQPESPNYTRTGRLRNDIAHEVRRGENAVYIGNSVKYAIFIHEGTRKMKARRYLKEAIIRYRDEYKAITEKILDKNINNS